MTEMNQTPVPASFEGMFLSNGRLTVRRQTLARRYQESEDLAVFIADFLRLPLAVDRSRDTSLREWMEQLVRPPGAVTKPEARWVISRAAEKMEWVVPGWANEHC